MTVDWKDLWLTIFGRTEWLGLNMGFWVSMAVVALIVILVNEAEKSENRGNKKGLTEQYRHLFAEKSGGLWAKPGLPSFSLF